MPNNNSLSLSLSLSLIQNFRPLCYQSLSSLLSHSNQSNHYQDHQDLLLMKLFLSFSFFLYTLSFYTALPQHAQLLTDALYKRPQTANSPTPSPPTAYYLFCIPFFRNTFYYFYSLSSHWNMISVKFQTRRSVKYHNRNKVTTTTAC